jgi:hypothetical protein
MKTPRIEMRNLDSGRDRLRAVVATIDHEISALPGEALRDHAYAKSERQLASSWAELVDLLALGPAPHLRECPVCGHTGMTDATRCGYCWTKLSPLAAGAIAAS